MFMLLQSSPRRFPLVLCQNFSSVFFFLLSGPGRCSCCFKRLFRSMETVCKVMRLLPYFVDNHRKSCAVSSIDAIDSSVPAEFRDLIQFPLYLTGLFHGCLLHFVKVMLHETIRNDDFQRNTALQCWNNVVAIRNNVATMLQTCVALKIVVAKRLV